MIGFRFPLIARESGASFTSQSQSNVKENQSKPEFLSIIYYSITTLVIFMMSALAGSLGSRCDCSDDENRRKIYHSSVSLLPRLYNKNQFHFWTTTQYFQLASLHLRNVSRLLQCHTVCNVRNKANRSGWGQSNLSKSQQWRTTTWQLYIILITRGKSLRGAGGQIKSQHPQI